MSAGKPDLRLITALACDDVRLEINHKEILIGVYGAGIRLALPADITVCLWLLVQWVGEGILPIDMRAIGTLGENLELPNATARAIMQGHPSTLYFRGLTIHVAAPGNLKFQWRKDGVNWETILDLRIVSATDA